MQSITFFTSYEVVIWCILYLCIEYLCIKLPSTLKNVLINFHCSKDNRSNKYITVFMENKFDFYEYINAKPLHYVNIIVTYELLNKKQNS